MEIREKLKQWLTDDAINMIGIEAFDGLPEDESIEVSILINGKGELDGIEVN